MLNRPHHRLKTRQNARFKLRTLNRDEVSAALEASLKQIADLKVEYPDLFKEWSRKEYVPRNIRETDSSIIVELEYPPVMDREGYPTTSQRGVATFEVSKNEDGTLAPRANALAPAPGLYRPRQRENSTYAAWLIALAWWCEQLKERLQPPSTSALLRPTHEPVVKEEPEQETDNLEVKREKLTVEEPSEAPLESKSEARPSNLPQQAKGEEDDLDSTRVAVEAIESHAASPAPPQARVVSTRKAAAPTENLIPVAASSEERAETVARMIAELNTLEPQMYGEETYEELKEDYPDFLIFAVSEQRKDLKELLVNIKESKRHIRLAQQCTGHYHGKRLVTVKDDWKHHKPEKFRSKKARKCRHKT